MGRKPRVLIACEFSGIVRDAFKRRGFYAVSCDLLPTERPGLHVRADVRTLLHPPRPWDLLIAFPPCTDLAVSGARYFAQKRADGRQQRALAFVRSLLNANARHVAIENPISVISSYIRKPDQIVQPWQFGHPESKATCFWLVNLPPLRPTKVLPRPASGRWENQTPSGQNKLGPSPTRAQDRSRTYVKIAQAMARQWGAYVKKELARG